jgi:hypothetical protein
MDSMPHLSAHFFTYHGGGQGHLEHHGETAGMAHLGRGAGRIDVRRGGERRFWIDGVGIGGWWCVAQRGVSERWWAGWPASPGTSRLSPSPVRRFWTALPRYEPWWPHDEPWCAVVAARSPTCAPRRQLASPLGSYRGRGCPKSPPKLSYSSRHRRRCRPARPPTPQNPPLRDAPPRSFPTR